MASGMAPKPDIAIGDYLTTRSGRTSVRCKGYTDPPYSGRYLGTIDKGVPIGPVEECDLREELIAVRIDGWWITVWKNGVNFAFKNRGLRR